MRSSTEFAGFGFVWHASLMATQSAVSQLLSTSQVSERLGLSTNAVIALCDSGQLPHFRIGAGAKKRYRIAEEDLVAYVESCRKSPEAKGCTESRDRQPASEGFTMLRSGGYRG
jgi:excisionase family DNA binding protein